MNEDQNIEYKRSWNDSYLKWVCGFANANGGMLEIGKDDKGRVVGVKNAAKLMEDLPNKMRDLLGIVADVDIVSEGGKEFVRITVEPYPYPISYKGEYHYRSGSTKKVLKGAALDRFLLRKQGRHWDGVPVPYITLEDCSNNAFSLFREKASKSGRVSGKVLEDDQNALLGNLQLVEGDYLKRAAVLLFYDDPESFVTGAYIKTGFFVTDDELRYQDEIHGNLFEQVDKTLELLFTKYLKAYIHYEGVQRVEKFLYPEGALREALLNAVVHKDYSAGVPIQISVYDDKVVIWNPGRLPDNWTLDRLMAKHPSKPFNPLIANAFFRTGYIESWGRGIEKIHSECSEHGIEPPVFDYGMSGLMVTFNANPQHMAGENEYSVRGKPRVKTREKKGRAGEETTQIIIDLISDNPKITMEEMADHIGITTKGIEWQMKKLKETGRISRVGPPRGGHWEINDLKKRHI